MSDFMDVGRLGSEIVRPPEPSPEQEPVRSSADDVWMMFCGNCGATVEADESCLCVQCRTIEESKKTEVKDAPQERKESSCRIGEHRDGAKGGKTEEAGDSHRPKRGRPRKNP
jgi:hypothetical protein